MTRIWTRPRLSSLLIAYTLAACGGPVVYASSQVLLERAHPSKAIAPGEDKVPGVAWVPIVRRPGGSICALGKDARSTCLKPAADQTEVDTFIVDMARVYKDYCACAQPKGDAQPNRN